MEYFTEFTIRFIAHFITFAQQSGEDTTLLRIVLTAIGTAVAGVAVWAGSLFSWYLKELLTDKKETERTTRQHLDDTSKSLGTATHCLDQISTSLKHHERFQENTTGILEKQSTLLSDLYDTVKADTSIRMESARKSTRKE